MKYSNEFKFDDLQGLLRFGHGQLPETCFLLLKIVDANAAKQWLSNAPVTSAIETTPRPQTALHIAFSVAGLRAIGLQEALIEGFSDEFITGMTGDESRSRRLGDIGVNAPAYWAWGGDSQQVPHVLILLYAKSNGIVAWRKQVEDKLFTAAFQLISQLPTQDMGKREPFGFADGISQPNIDWANRQSTDTHHRAEYSNWLAPGEIVLGYPNEYKQYTVRPLIDPQTDALAAILPIAEDQPALKDFARNGSYLVLRQLDQDVPGFWQFLNKATDGAPEQLAAAMVGRQLNDAPLMPTGVEKIPGVPVDDQLNQFNYVADPRGNVCPIGAHIRRANPRTGDLPAGVTGLLTRLIRILGFGLKHPNDDLVASSRFHRLLRRGRTYGPPLSPAEASKPDALIAERGLQFICLVANISRQFEFVQNAWLVNSKFAGLQNERDPLLAHRQPLNDGTGTDRFQRPDPSGPVRDTCHLPQFISVRGGAYFFMPGLSALKYIASLPSTGRGHSS